MNRLYQPPYRPAWLRNKNGSASAGNGHHQPDDLTPHRAAAILGLALDELLLLSRLHGIGRPPLPEIEASDSGPFFTHEDLVRLARFHDSRRIV